jgi:tRNA(fMet)-specific endonuclease VapC
LVTTYQRLRATQAYFCTITILPFDDPAAALYRVLQSRRIRTGTNDLRIAAIALAHRAILVTSNQRDFEQIEGCS